MQFQPVAKTLRLTRGSSAHRSGGTQPCRSTTGVKMNLTDQEMLIVYRINKTKRFWPIRLPMIASILIPVIGFTLIGYLFITDSTKQRAELLSLSTWSIVVGGLCLEIDRLRRIIHKMSANTELGKSIPSTVIESDLRRRSIFMAITAIAIVLIIIINVIHRK